MDMLYAMLSSVEVLYRNCTYLNDLLIKNWWFFGQNCEFVTEKRFNEIYSHT